MLIFTARYIPVGRVAVNWIAGTTAYPRRRFVILDVFASITWVAYSAGVGIIAGNWVHEHPLLGVGIAIAFAIVLGIVIDHAADLAAPLARHPGRRRGGQPGRHHGCRREGSTRRRTRPPGPRRPRPGRPPPASPLPAPLTAPADVEA